MCELRKLRWVERASSSNAGQWSLSVRCQWRLPRDFRNWVRDFCATFRENDMQRKGRKLARRAFATNEIN